MAGLRHQDARSPSVDDLEATLANPSVPESDERGNTRLAGETDDHRPILVVVARDDPDFVITVFLLS